MCFICDRISMIKENTNKPTDDELEEMKSKLLNELNKLFL